LIDEHILVPHRWRRMLTWARIVLALGCLVLELFFSEPQGHLVPVLLVLFLIYSILAVSWRRGQRASYAVLSLILDSLFLLICASIRSPFGYWFSIVFCVYLMTTAVLFHEWKVTLAIGVIPVALLPLVRPADADSLVPLVVAVTALAVVAAWHRERIVGRLLQASRQAVMYRSEAEKIQRAERERIAADFHDGPQQSFISLQLRLEVLRKLLERDPEAARKELARIQDLSRAQVAEIRTFVRSMRPVEMDGAGFTSTLSRLVDGFEKDSGISTTFTGSGDVELNDPDRARELIQIVREALHNAQKHSGATRVAVGLERNAGYVEISIQDNGSGFPFAGAYSLEELDLLHLGPASIKRRVRGLGGDLRVDSRPGFGSGLKIRVEG